MDDNKELQEQFPSIKLIKNSKGYNYEIKILSLDVNEIEALHDKINALIKKWETQE